MPAAAPFRIEAQPFLVTPWRDAAADREGLRRLATDPLVVRYISDGVPWDDAARDGFLGRQRANLVEHGVCLGAVRWTETGEVVGLAGLQPLGTTGDYEAGWWLAPSLWGRGHATTIARALMRHAVAIRRWPRLTAIAHPENAASRAVMSKLGMTFRRTVRRGDLGYTHSPDVVVVLYAMDLPGSMSVPGSSPPDSMNLPGAPR